MKRLYDLPRHPEFAVHGAILLVILYVATQILVNVAMLLATKLSSVVQGFPLENAEVIAATGPLGAVFGLIIAGLLVTRSYFPEKNSAPAMLVAFRQEFVSGSRWQHIVTGAIGLCFAMVCVSIVQFQLASDFSRTPTLEKTLGAREVCWIISVLVFTPIAEEVLFRGVLYRAMIGKYGEVAFIVVSAALFCAIHLIEISHNRTAVTAILAFGLLASTARVLVGRLGPCITLHFAYNTVVVLSVVAETTS